jgi:hypothetical protein
MVTLTGHGLENRDDFTGGRVVVSLVDVLSNHADAFFVSIPAFEILGWKLYSLIPTLWQRVRSSRNES